MSADRLARRLIERLGLGRLGRRVLRPPEANAPPAADRAGLASAAPPGDSAAVPAAVPASESPPRDLAPGEVATLRRELAEELARLATRRRVAVRGDSPGG